MSSVPSLTFAVLLKRLRLAAGLTQEQLAERARLSVEAIGALERGTRRAPRKETVALLAEALALTASERAELEAAARGRLASVSAATRGAPLHLVRVDEDQAEPEQPAFTKPLAPVSFTSQAERASQPESVPLEPPLQKPKSSLRPARLLRKRAVLVVVLLLVVVGAASSGLGYWLKLGPFGKSALTTVTPAPAYVYAQPTHTGGTITISDTGALGSTNPWFALSSVSYALWGSPYTVSPAGFLLPDELAAIPTLANGDVSKDGLAVTMRLRPDLRWSDGQPLTADDFVYWLDVERDKKTGASNCCYGYDQIASYQPLNVHTLVLRYKRVFAPYLTYLPWAAPRHAWGSIPDQDLGKYLDAEKGIYLHPEVTLYPTVTSGPFKIASRAGDQRITMVPNPYYHSTTLHRSVLDQLIYTNYLFDVDALIADFQAGQTDFADSGLLVNDLPRISGLPGYHFSREIGYNTLEFNLSRSALQAVNVRKAIEETIDRCGMIQTIFEQPCANLRVDTIFPAPSPAYDATIKTYGYDLAQARKDMLIDGWDCSSGHCIRNGQAFPPLRLVTFAGPRFQKTAEVIQQNLAALGITVILDDNYSISALFDTYTNGGILAQGRYDLTLFAEFFDIDPDGSLYPSFHSSQIPSASYSTGQNYEQLNDPNIDSLLDQERVTLDGATRLQLFKEIQRDLVKDVDVVPLYLRPNVVLVNPNIGNYQDNPFGVGNLWNVGDWFLAQ